MADYLKSDVKAGAMIIFCVILLGFLTFYIGGFKKFETSYEIRILADSAYGVGQASIVTFSGVKVGEVKSLRVRPESEIKADLIKFNNPDLTLDDIRIEMVLKVKASVFLREDSRTEIVGSGLVGDQIVNLTPGTLSSPDLPRENPIIGVHLTGLGKLQKGIGKINFDVLIPNVRKIVMNLTEASERIKATTVKVDELLGDLDRKNQISSMLDRTEKILINLDEVVSESSGDIRSAASNFNQATLDLRQELKPTLVSLRGAVDDMREVMAQNKQEINEIIAEFKKTAVNFNQFSSKVKKYPWTLIHKTKVAKEDEELFPQSANIKVQKSSKERDKAFFFF